MIDARDRRLSMLAAAPSTPCQRKPSDAAAAAANGTGRSPTARTPATGAFLTPRLIAASDASTSWKRTAIARSLHGSSSL
jgi:hypothetical protein